MSQNRCGPASFVWDQKGGESVRVFGEEVRIHVRAEQTSGAFSIIEQCCEVGKWSWAHRHRNEHHFVEVVEGNMEFEVEGEKWWVKEGQFVFVPKMNWHRFRAVGSANATMRFLNLPGGLEKMFLELAEMEQGGKAGVEEQEWLAEKYGVEVAGAEGDKR